jgi:predicted amidohydrolase YtcJ
MRWTLRRRPNCNIATFDPLLLLVLLALVVGVGCGGPKPEPASLVLRGGKIVTMDPERPEARAVAVRGDRIVAVGSEREIAAYVGGATEVIELEGRTVVPAFIEGHAHLTGLGRALMNLDLRDARTWDEVVAKVAEAASSRPAGSWILGWGWHQDKWDEPPAPSVEGYPVHDALSAAVPNHPVLLRHAAGGHAAIANARALLRAGITANTPDPPGGTILRDARGRATGVLRETAYGLVERARQADLARRDAATILAEQRREIELAAEESLRNGVASFQTAGESFETVDLLREMVREGSLPIRVWVMLRAPNAELADRLDAYRIEGEWDHHLTVRAIKHALDGALGSHGAWLLEPYSDLPGSTGLNTSPVEEVEETARLALAHGYQLAVHAIGDRANREALDLFERVLRDDAEGTQRRWRIEHAQHLHPDDLPRFAQLGVIASMQGIHCSSDGPWVPQRLEHARCESGAYVWRKLLESGAVVSNGTDAPIEDVDPIANFHASVTRLMRTGETFYPEQRMSREEALRSYTLSAAYAAFEEEIKGSITPGKLADLVVLTRDLMTVLDEEILGTEVEMTVVGGRVRYRR